MEVPIDLQLKFIAKHGVFECGDSQEEILASLQEEFKSGMYDRSSIDFLISSIGQDAEFYYAVAHNGKLPGVQ